jgi:hypothetical protein
MTHAPLTLWHGTSTGDKDARLRSILDTGLTAQFNNARISGQSPGVYFSAHKSYAIDRALRCIGKLQRGGRPVLLGIKTDLNPDEWDWDFEVSRPTVENMLKTLKLSIPDSSIHIPYAFTDYRHRVGILEQSCRRLRATNENIYREKFSAAALHIQDTEKALAFKYTGQRPLKIQNVIFI